MAKKKTVNTKFAIILGAVILALFAAVGGAAMFVLNKSAEDSKKEAEAALAAGDIEKALGLAGRAVRKEPGNVKYLEYWVSIMEKTQPLTKASYADRFFREYMVALQRIADVQRTNVAAHERVLDTRLLQLTLGRADPAQWVEFVAMVEKAMGFFRPEDAEQAKQRAIIGRYRGLARTHLIGSRANVTDDERAQARQDLEAALAADPNLDDALLGWSEWMGVEADRQRERGDTSGASQTFDAIKAKVAEARQRNPKALGGALAEARVRLSEMAARASQPGANRSRAQLQTEAQPWADELLKVIESADAKTLRLEPLSSASLLVMQTGLPSAFERLTAVWQRVVDLDKNNPVPYFYFGQIAINAGKPEECIRFLQPMVELKDLPLSLNGLLLFDMRPFGRYLQASASTILAESAAAGAERDEATKRAVAFRDAYAKEVDTTEPGLQLLDGKIAILKNDLITARQLLSSYTANRTTDVEGLRLLARVVGAQNSVGAARDLWQRITELQPESLEAWLFLAETQLALQDRSGALISLRRAESLNPGNEDIRARRAKIEEVMEGARSADPLVRAMAQADEQINAVPQNIEGAKETLRKAAADMKDSADVVSGLGLVRALAMMGEREEAEKAMAKLAVKNAEDPRFKAMRADLDRAAAGPTATDDIIDRINKTEGATDFQKAVSRLMVYEQRGDKEKAAAELQNAKRLSPDDPYVLSREFESALTEKKWEEAGKLVERAAATNADKAKGAIFRAGLEQAQGRLPEAIALIQRAAEADTLNAALWRKLGQLRMENQEMTTAVAALERAQNIQPNDPETVVSLMRARIIAGDNNGALALARQSTSIAGRNQLFLNMWLQLETEVGKSDLALDRRQRLFEADPLDRMNASALLRLLITKGDVQGAQKVLDSAEKNGWADSISPLKCLFFARQGKLDEARAVFDALVQKTAAEERSVGLYIGFARELFQLGADELAEQILISGRPLQKPDLMEIERELGDQYFARARMDKAVACYQAALDSVKDDPEGVLRQRIAECHIRLQKFPEADAVLSQIKPGNDEARYRVLLLRAEAKARGGEKPAARALLDEAVALKPREWLAYFKRAEAAVGDVTLLSDAIEDLEEAMRLNPSVNEVRILLGGLLVSRGDTDKGVQVLREGLDRDPGNDQLRRALINGLVRLGNGEQAVKLAEDAWERNRRLPWAGQAGDLHLMMGKPQLANRYFDELWTGTLKDPQATVDDLRSVALRFVNTLMASQPPELARAKQVVGEKRLEVDASPAMRLLRAWIAMRDARPKDAEADVLAAYRSLDVDNFNQVGEFTRSLDQVFARPQQPLPIAQMVTLVRDVLMKEKSSDVMEYHLAMLKSRDPATQAEAQKEIERLVTAGKNPMVIRNCAAFLGNAAYTKKDYAKAVEAYDVALKAMPDDPELLNNKGYTLAKNLNKPADGLPFIRRAAELAPNNPNVLDSLGAVYMLLGKFDEAEPPLQASLNSARNDLERAPAMLHLIEVKLAKQDRSAADELFRRFQAMVASERAPKRIESTFREDIDRVTRLLQGGN